MCNGTLWSCCCDFQVRRNNDMYYCQSEGEDDKVDVWKKKACQKVSTKLKCDESRILNVDSGFSFPEKTVPDVSSSRAPDPKPDEMYAGPTKGSSQFLERFLTKRELVSKTGGMFQQEVWVRVISDTQHNVHTFVNTNVGAFPNYSE